jgi:hypothetical protein
MLEVMVELGLKSRVAARLGVSLLDRQNQRHQSLGDEAPAINAEMASFVRPAAKCVWYLQLYPSIRFIAQSGRAVSN